MKPGNARARDRKSIIVLRRNTDCSRPILAFSWHAYHLPLCGRYSTLLAPARSYMKLHLHTEPAQNNITAHGPGYVVVSGQRIEHAVIVTPEHLINPWTQGGVSALVIEDFAALLDWKPALVVFGSGAQFRFPHPRLLAAFSQARIGFDVMDTPAACRTYNVLMSEGRRVAAALLVD